MTKLSKKKAEIKAELIQHGWKEDRWGHLQKTGKHGSFRVKFQKVSIRKEIKIDSRWVKISNGYISKATIINAIDGIIDFGN